MGLVIELVRHTVAIVMNGDNSATRGVNTYVVDDIIVEGQKDRSLGQLSQL